MSNRAFIDGRMKRKTQIDCRTEFASLLADHASYTHKQVNDTTRASMWAPSAGTPINATSSASKKTHLRSSAEQSWVSGLGPDRSLRLQHPVSTSLLQSHRLSKIPLQRPARAQSSFSSRFSRRRQRAVVKHVLQERHAAIRWNPAQAKNVVHGIW